MKVLGITGSSGSGKTTLSAILSKEDGIEVIDADKVAKELAKPGNEYLKAIENTFGKEILFSDGKLNRKLLANKIYTDNTSKEKLNALTFKYVFDNIKDTIDKLKESNLRFVVIDAPLLFESKLDQFCDKVIVMVADKDLKIERITKRDNIEEDTARKRLDIQEDDEYYTSKADFVIVNKRNCNLKVEVDNILKNLEVK